MKKQVFVTSIVSVVLAFAPVLVWAVDDAPGDPSAPESAEPTSPAPEQPPPAPLRATPQPPPRQPGVAAQSTAATATAAAGQWVFTGQYGWVWMPYASAYTYVPPNGGEPYMYVYDPSFGWTWVAAPWVVGWGPAPYFGVAGPTHFVFFAWWPPTWRAVHLHPQRFHGHAARFHHHARPFVGHVRPLDRHVGRFDGHARGFGPRARGFGGHVGGRG